MITPTEKMSSMIEKIATEKYEPQINSEDPAERKLARKLRIERRLEAINKQNISSESNLATCEKSDPISQQLQKSTKLLEKLMIEGDEYITNVRVASDAREVDRRESEGINRANIIAQLEEEAAAAKHKFDEIAEKWPIIQQYNDPLHIHEDIINQKEKCDLLVTQKDELIAKLKQELITLDDSFVKDQKKQKEDIKTLSDRIEKQVKFMRKSLRQELAIIEEVILMDRQLLIDSNNKKWDELHKKRDDAEIESSEKRFERIENFEKKMTKLRVDFQEHFRSAKIKLENSIEELQREFERIKALALLNTEKLDYNYQILKKREDENIIIKSQQKRRINKLQDVINVLRNKITEYEGTSKSNIEKLTQNIAKLQRNILDIENKADHFAKINDSKFKAIWNMNIKSVEAILQKILDTDKILYEQQLGVEWTPPASNILDKTLLPSYKAAVQLLHETEDTKKSSKLKAAKKNQDGKDHEAYRIFVKRLLMKISDKSGFLAESKIRLLLEPYAEDQKALVRVDHVFEALKVKDKSAIDLLVEYFMPYTYCPICAFTDATVVESSIRTDTGTARVTASFKTQSDTSFYNGQDVESVEFGIHEPLEVIDEIVDSLVDSRTTDVSGAYAEQQTALVVQANILEGECLGPESQMKDSPSTYSATEKKTITSMHQSHFDTLKQQVLMQCQFNHPLMISSVYITEALTQFVGDYHVKDEYVPSLNDRVKKKRNTISRLLAEEDIKTFWERYSSVFDKDRERVWDALLVGLKRYHEVLKDRKSLSEEVVGLRRQNHELKRLLSNYLTGGDDQSNVCDRKD